MLTPSCITYGGTVWKSDGETIELPVQTFLVEDSFTPEPDVGIFGEPGLLLVVPYACDPEGVVFMAKRDWDDYQAESGPAWEELV